MSKTYKLGDLFQISQRGARNIAKVHKSDKEIESGIVHPSESNYH